MSKNPFLFDHIGEKKLLLLFPEFFLWIFKILETCITLVHCLVSKRWGLSLFCDVCWESNFHIGRCWERKEKGESYAWSVCCCKLRFFVDLKWLPCMKVKLKTFSSQKLLINSSWSQKGLKSETFPCWRHKYITFQTFFHMTLDQNTATSNLHRFNGFTDFFLIFIELCILFENI